MTVSPPTARGQAHCAPAWLSAGATEDLLPLPWLCCQNRAEAIGGPRLTKSWRPTVTLIVGDFTTWVEIKDTDVFLDIIKRGAEYKHKINNLKYVKSTYLKT